MVAAVASDDPQIAPKAAQPPIEADLDEILKDRLASDDEDDDDEEDEVADAAGKSDGPAKIQPRRSDEFLCQSCFILKPRGQLAEGETDLCVDCV